MQIRIFSPTDLTAPLFVVPRFTDPLFLVERNRDGAGSFKIRTDDPAYQAGVDIGAFDEGNLVCMTIVGKDCWWEIEKPTVVSIGASDKRFATIAGTGLFSWPRRAVVYPKVGDPTSESERRFNFAGVRGSWYVPSEWGTPVVVGATNSAGSAGTGWWFGPGKWPLPGIASWIWDRNASTTAPAGDVYFRYEFNLTGGTRTVRLYASARDVAALFMDGVRVATISEFGAYQRTVQVDLELSPGAHVFAARARKTSTGPAGLLAMLSEVRDTTEDMVPADKIWATGGAGWDINAYPAKAPGWTAGQVLKALMGEARARGVTSLLRLTDTFTETHDSAGVPWADRFDWSFRHGSTYRDVLADMSAIVADTWVGSDFTLNVAQTRGVDRSVAVAGADPVQIQSGKNVLSSKTTPEGEDIITALLVMTDDGLIERSTTSSAKIGRREAYLSATSASKNGTAPLLAQQVFEQRAVRRLNPEVEIIGVPGATPFVDFDVADYVLAPSDDGRTLVKRRIASISYSEAEKTTQPVWSIEIDSIAMTADERLARWIQRTDAGSLSGAIGGTAGTTSSLTPSPGVPTSPDPVIPGTKIQTPRAPTSLDGQSSAYLDRSGRPLSQVLLTWPEVTLDTAGVEVLVEGYEIWQRRPAVSAEWISAGTVGGTSVAIGGFSPGQAWEFRVRTVAARSQNPSAYSPTKSIVMAIDDVPPPAPSKPVLAARLGAITVRWDGRDAAGDAMPADLDHVNVLRLALEEALTRRNFCYQPTPERPDQPVTWTRYGGATPNDAYRDPTDSAGGAASFAYDVTATGIMQGAQRYFGVGLAGSHQMMIKVKSPVGRPVTVTFNTATTTVNGTGNWESLILTSATTSDYASVQVTVRALVAPEGEPFTFHWDRVDIEKGIDLSRTYMDGDTPGCVWDGTPGLSSSTMPIYTESVIGRLFPTSGSNQLVDVDQPYNTVVRYALTAVDTSANVSGRSEIAQIVVKPLVDTDIIGKIITDANIVNVDGSKINPSTIETTSLKVGQANLLADPRFLDESLRTVRAASSTSNFVSWQGVWGLVLAAGPAGTAWFGTTAAECSPTTPMPWIDVIGGQTYSLTAQAESVGTGLVSLRVRARFLLDTGAYTTIQTIGETPVLAADSVADVSMAFAVPANAVRMAVGVFRFTGVTTQVVTLRNVGLRPNIGGVLIEAGAITAPKIAALAIEAGKIAANAVTADKILAGAVTAVKIDADAVTAVKLDALAITAKHTITSAKYQTTETPLRGIEITTTGLRAYNSAGAETVSISATTGAVAIAGTFRTGVDVNQVVISDGIFRGRPGIRFDTGSSAALEPTIQSMGVASSGYPAGSFIITGRETTTNSTGRADLQLDAGGNFALRTQYGSYSNIGIDKTGWDLYIRGKMFGGAGSGLAGGILQQEFIRTAAIPPGGTQGFTFGTPRPSGTTLAQCTPFSTDAASKPQFVVNVQDTTRVQVALTRDNASACFGNLFIGWV